MSEGDAVLAATAPATRASLAAELAALGVPRGGVLIAHLSLSALGWTAGGALALLDALGDALGPEGTLVLPAFSSDLSEPSRWQAPPVPEAWWETIRAELPAFDPARTPTRGLGRAPELFRTLPGVQRSTHPTSSFAARGPLAAELLGGHSLDLPLGEGSPLARLYERDARVLLLGVGHERNTSLHLAEHRASWPAKRTLRQGAPVREPSGRRWVEFDELDVRDDDFPACGRAFAASGAERSGRVARAEARLFRQRELVDFAAEWFSEQRSRAQSAPLELELRPVGPAELERWAELRHRLWPQGEPSELRAEAEQLLSEPARAQAYFACAGDEALGPQVLGFVELTRRERAPGSGGQPVGYVEGWYVEPSARGQGVGRFLIAAAREWTRAQGLRLLASDTTPRYRGSRAAHLALGFREVRVEHRFLCELA
ncbi:MAG TPA: hypothetical protein DEA08_13145 [Planctomycetes bacterium]|nr:hypothetical protein [Planctomycetota bacterium]